jgi:uncharacterized membrane protein
MRVGRWTAIGIAAFLVSVLTSPAWAQTAEGLTLATNYPGIIVKPGDTPTFDVTVTAPVGTNVSLAVPQEPDGWTITLRGGGFVVSSADVIKGTVDSNGVVGTTGTVDVKVEVAVPADAAEGDYPVVLQGTSSAGAASLQMDVQVSAVVSGGVTLTSGFPDLRGGSNTTFTYALDLTNNTSEDIDFALAAEGPTGWSVDAKPSAQSRAATVTVPASSKTTITVDVDPPNDAPAGTYQTTVTASSTNETAETQLTTEITGSYAILLGTADQTLNATVHAGAASTVAIQVDNTGSAPLQQVTLTATPPNGWQVDFSPATIDTVAPGEVVDVTATITAASDAVAGDYRLTLLSKVPEAQDQIELRVTVQTSALWGFVGIALVVIALGGLGVVFWRLGRR